MDVPEFNAIEWLTIAILLLLAAALGWWLRARRENAKLIARDREWREQLDALQRSEKRTNAQRKELAAEIAELRTAKAPATLKSETDPSPLDLETRLAESFRRRDDLTTQLQKLIAKSRDLGNKSREKDEKIFALSRELESWQQRLPPLLERYRDKDLQNTVILEQLEAERARIGELSETLHTRLMPVANDARAVLNNTNGVTAAQSANDDSHQNKDDLKRIKGVGPVLEKTLNKLGIFKLSQIAHLNDSEINRIAEQLPQFPGRIKRDQWIEQARQLTD